MQWGLAWAAGRRWKWDGAGSMSREVDGLGDVFGCLSFDFRGKGLVDDQQMKIKRHLSHLVPLPCIRDIPWRWYWKQLGPQGQVSRLLSPYGWVNGLLLLSDSYLGMGQNPHHTPMASVQISDPATGLVSGFLMFLEYPLVSLHLTYNLFNHQKRKPWTCTCPLPPSLWRSGFHLWAVAAWKHVRCWSKLQRRWDKDRFLDTHSLGGPYLILSFRSHKWILQVLGDTSAQAKWGRWCRWGSSSLFIAN